MSFAAEFILLQGHLNKVIYDLGNIVYTCCAIAKFLSLSFTDLSCPDINVRDCIVM